MEGKSDNNYFEVVYWIFKNIPIHRENKTVRLPWDRGGREKIKGRKKRDKMKENNLEFTVNLDKVLLICRGPQKAACWWNK